MGPLLPINPPETKSLIQCFRIGYGRLGGVLLGNSQPDSVRLAMILTQPLAKLRGRAEKKNFPFAS